MPAFPPETQLDLAAVLSPPAAEVSDAIAHLCWSDSEVTTLVESFTTTPFLTPLLDDGPVIEGVEHANFDRTCASDPSPEMTIWCDWIRFNNPGPRGTSPLPKLPKRGDALAPMLIAAGSNDAVVHCLRLPAAEPNAVPPGTDYIPAALYESFAADYCPGGAARGHLSLNIWRQEAGVTEAGPRRHPGILATADFETPRYEGSPLQRFITAAFEGTLTPAVPQRSSIAGSGIIRGVEVARTVPPGTGAVLYTALIAIAAAVVARSVQTGRYCCTAAWPGPESSVSTTRSRIALALG